MAMSSSDNNLPPAPADAAADPNTGPPSRHRADDDLEALASGSFAPLPPATTRTSTDLLDSTRSGLSTTSDMTDDEDSDIAEIVNPAINMAAMTDGLDIDEDEEDVDENEPLELHYGSDDDDISVEDNDVGNSVELSQRTRNLMDSFRNYVSDMGEEADGKGNGSGDDLENGTSGFGFGGSSGGFGSISASDAPLIGSSSSKKIVGLLRDFTINEEEEDHIAAEYGSPRIRSEGNYRYSWLRSKRVKRAFGTILLASLIMGVAIAMSKAKKEKNLPDWNKQLDEMLEEEKDRNDHLGNDGSIMAVPSEPLQKHPELPFDQTNVDHAAMTGAGNKPSDTKADQILSDVLTHAASQPSQESQQVYLMMAKKYQPIWFSRQEDGYMGTTYQDALLFCAEQDMMIPCPYEAYCPAGPYAAPSGGYREDIEDSGDADVVQWAPVIDDANSWVQVSSGDDNGCMLYEFLHAGRPAWGEKVREDGEENEINEEGTRFVLCCQSGGLDDESLVDFTLGAEGPDAFGADEPGYNAEAEAEAMEATMEGNGPIPPAPLANEDDPPPPNVNDPFPPSPTTVSSDGPQKTEAEIYQEEEAILAGLLNKPASAEVIANEYADAEGMKPIWYGRDTGWEGKTYSEAVEFCDAQLNYDGEQLTLCPYEAYCPTGPRHLPYGGVQAEPNPDGSQVNMWAPMSDSNNDWVQVGPGGNVCLTYMNLNLVTPSWGTGRGNEEITRFVLCCRSGIDSDDNDKGPLSGLEEPVTGSPSKQPTIKPVTESPVTQPTAKPAYSPIAAELEGVMTTAQEGYLEDLYEPVWYDRATGWEGKTYDEASDFCMSKGPNHNLCPYEVYCPQGRFSVPYGGGLQETLEHGELFWAPIIERDNDWVQIGKQDVDKDAAENTMCLTYISLNLMAPVWGKTGQGAEKKTGYLLCCNHGETTAEVATTTATPEPTMKPTPEPTTEPTTKRATEPTPLPTHPPLPQQPAPAIDNTNDSHNGSNSLAHIIQLYQPLWQTRSDGWSGQTYLDAVDFCKSKITRSSVNPDGEPLMLCPYEAYCPSGEGSEPFGGAWKTSEEEREGQGGIGGDDTIWAPIANGDNQWVQLGKENMCMLYTTIYPDEPAWGITGKGSKELTRHVLCCKSGRVGQELDVTGVATSPEAPQSALEQNEEQGQPDENAYKMAQELEPIYDVINRAMYGPMGYSRFNGWTGQNYQEATEFCSSKNDKVPCPMKALCPNGLGNSEPFDSMDPIWAPVPLEAGYSDDSQAWVEVKKGGYCVKHTALKMYEDVTRYALCCKQQDNAYPLEDEHGNVPFNLIQGDNQAAVADFVDEEQSAVGAPPPSQYSQQMDAIYKEIGERFNPVHYSRNTGWDGQTYGAALEFCASKDSNIPCPYEAICPMGKNGPPIGGAKDGPNGVWVPIMDTANGWVSIGHKDTCVRYNDLKPHPPNWGLTGKENEAITQHVKCCVEVDGTGPKLEEEEMEFLGELTNTEEVVLDTMHPVWFGREHGYHGTTHEEAEIFCRTIGNMHLCPVEAYCPNGPRDSKVLFLQKDAYEGEQWAPVSSYNNEDTSMGNNWIMVGKKFGQDLPATSCQQYEQLYDGKSPPWAADGSQNNLKEHVLCCIEQEAMKREQDIARGMNPIWLDKSHGWSGGSYEDGQQFCKGLGGKRLCPYAAYCPHGPGMNPMGGHSSDFNIEGVQWAPVHSDEGNAWVMVGRKYGNTATTCYTHEELEGKAPDWGLNRDNPGAKLHIQCCSF